MVNPYEYLLGENNITTSAESSTKAKNYKENSTNYSKIFFVVYN